MEALFQSGSLGDAALLLGVAATRVALAFMLVPLFTSDLIPALVRNAMFLAIAMLSLTVQPAIQPLALSSIQWVGLYAKEAFIGATIGIFFSATMWAFESAGP